jgi:WD40-like Beta Propeller Repeat
MGKVLIFCLIAIALFSGCQKSYDEFALTGEYMGQVRPEGEPQLFLPGIICTGMYERDGVFSKDGKEFFYTVWALERGTLVTMKMNENGEWSSPAVASFSGKYSDIEPFITPDGQKLYFASQRPLTGEGEAKDYDIWYIDKTDTGWSDPVNIGLPVNTEKDEFYPTLSENGTLYLNGIYDECYGPEDLYRFEFVDGQFVGPENLGEKINTNRGEFNAMIAPDESYLIFGAYKPDIGVGHYDNFISFRDENGNWGDPKALPEPINSTAWDFCPSLSPDGLYFFFSSHRILDAGTPEVPASYNDLAAAMESAGNGTGDIYWVQSDFIETLRD